MAKLTMLDRSECPKGAVALKALALANKGAGTPGPGAWAFYLGGAGHNGGNGSTWTNAVLDTLAKAGVHLLPIYVGKQSGLTPARGVSDAQDAMRLAHEFKDRHTTLCIDIERKTGERDLPAAVRYVSSWTTTLHAAGLRSIVYCSVDLAEALKKGAPLADAIWVPRYRAHAPQAKRDPHAIPGITGFTKAGQRGWQYAAKFADEGAEKETDCIVGGINVDVSCIDSEVFSSRPGVTAATVVTPAKKPPVKAAPETAAKPPANAAPAAKAKTITVKDNDILSRLEKTLHLTRGSLFAVNHEVIEAAAHMHGHQSSENGDKIFAGTVLRLPD